MFGLIGRIQRAGADISEALSVGVQPAPGAPVTPPGSTSAPAMSPSSIPPPQGALSAGPPPGAPQMRPANNPLTVMTDFKSPPMAAALQGGRGQESLQRPIGFARGGYAVIRER